VKAASGNGTFVWVALNGLRQQVLSFFLSKQNWKFWQAGQNKPGNMAKNKCCKVCQAIQWGPVTEGSQLEKKVNRVTLWW